MTSASYSGGIIAIITRTGAEESPLKGKRGKSAVGSGFVTWRSGTGLRRIVIGLQIMFRFALFFRTRSVPADVFLFQKFDEEIEFIRKAFADAVVFQLSYKFDCRNREHIRRYIAKARQTIVTAMIAEELVDFRIAEFTEVKERLNFSDEVSGKEKFFGAEPVNFEQVKFRIAERLGDFFFEF